MGMKLWFEAAAFAARAHEGQTRRDGRTPYAAHPFRVALTVRDVFGCDDEVALAIALLHDVIEDTPADYDDIEEAFGEAVARGVAALTKDMRVPEPEREPAYDEGLARSDWRAKLVKLADVHDNLLDRKDTPEKPLKKCERALAIARADGDERLQRGIEAVEGVVRFVRG